MISVSYLRFAWMLRVRSCKLRASLVKFNCLFVAVNNGSSANWESVKQTTRPMTNAASPSMVYTTANSKSEQLAA